MVACMLRTILRTVGSFSPTLQHRLRGFSSSSLSPVAANPKANKFFFDDSGEDGSSVYRHALKFQRPSTIRWQPQLQNCVSFIGTVDRPIEQVSTFQGNVGAFTLLNVKASPTSNRYFKIFLKMEDKIAEQSIKYLKANDCIYVSGRLVKSMKVNENGKVQYKVNVEEINSVAEDGQCPKYKVSRQSDLEGESASERLQKRLNLWQVFFSNPSEWRDCRKSKKTSPNHPDFKHKDTGEALWLSDKDPPWIKRQLEIQDSWFSSARGKYDDKSCSSFSQWL